MDTNRKIKLEATKRMNYLVFEQFYAPRDIVVECADGTYVRKLIQWVGGFRWANWVRR